MSARRIRAIILKEIRDYRRNRSVLVAMAIVSLIFVIQPAASIFSLAASSAATLMHRDPLIYMLGIPSLIPAALAAYAVAGERQQGTLEPVLTTPIRAEELLIAKALAVFVPVVLVSYAVVAVFVVLVEAFSNAAVASAVVRAGPLLGAALFIPLVAAWSVWVAIGISARVADIRVAQQLASLVGLLAIAVSTLISIGVIRATTALTIGLAAGLLVMDGFGWRVVAALFDRERLIVGGTRRRARRAAPE